MPSIKPPELGLFADNDQIEAARASYEAELAEAMSSRGGMGGFPAAMLMGQNILGSMATSPGGFPAAMYLGQGTTPTAQVSRLNVNTGKQETKGMAQGGEVQRYDGLSGSYVEGREYPDYTTEEEEPTSFFDRTIGRYMGREKEMMLADDALEKYKLEKGVMPWTKQTKAERDAYDKGLSELKQKRKEAGKSIFPSFGKTIMAPTIEVNPEDEKKKALADIEAKKKALDNNKDTSQNAYKKANDDYLKTLKQTNADQISSYDESMKRVMDLAKNDPYRDQLRAEYEKEKSGAFYDVLGDIGASLAGAKKGQEGQALQQGFTAATSRVKDLRKQKRDLMLAEQKADRDYQMLGAKYGFDSEQARAALAAKERMAEAENKVKLEYGKVISGGRSGSLDLNAKKAASKDFLSWQEKNLATVMMANRPLTGDKKRDAETAAAQRKLVEMQNYYTNYYSANSGASANPSSVLQFDSSGKLITNEE
jgi:hypothetical protein